MRVSRWLIALLALTSLHAAYAGEVAADDNTSMEVIEMLGEMDDEVADLDIAMSDVNVKDLSAPQEVSNEK